MIVYVESNFVLEAAFLQEEHESCAEILALAESGRIALAMPAFCVAECYDALGRRARRRAQIRDQVARELRELSRARPYADRVRELNAITTLLVQSADEEKDRLDAVLSRMLDSSELIPVGASTIRAAVAYQSSLGLEPQDSIIYASVLEHLASASHDAKCFMNRNVKDFLIPDIQDELDRYHCRLVSSFTDGLGLVRRELASK